MLKYNRVSTAMKASVLRPTSALMLVTICFSGCFAGHSLSVRDSNSAEKLTISRIISCSVLDFPVESAVFVVSNKCDVPISVWRISDDGFGYEIEALQDRKWKPITNRLWCATGRETVEIPSGGNYCFTIPIPLNIDTWRITIEYWVGKFGDGNLKSISSVEQRGARVGDSVQIK
jgi:hypothetical protein